MPELPEVETTCRGIRPLLTGKQILELVLRVDKLRLPLDPQWSQLVAGQRIVRVERRAKYLLLTCSQGTIILHLGMSGSLRILPAGATEGKHDHIDMIMTDGTCLRFSDPRKFGTFLYTTADPARHRLLAALGPEPLSAPFTGAYLYQCSRKRRQAIKTFIMDQQVVVGVGNIYANEALFASGINPAREAGRVSLQRYQRLVTEIRTVLQKAIAAGGTTLQDFTQSDGKPGYFKQQLNVYGRAGLPCVQCGHPVGQRKLGQRSTFYCPVCQK